jgi:voltage-gated potassium channel
MDNSLKKSLGELVQVAVTLLIILMIADIILLLAVTFFSLKPNTIYLIFEFDVIVSIFTFFIFLISLRKFKDKRKFLRNNWIILVASFPIVFIFWGVSGLADSLIIFGIFNIVKIYAMIRTVMLVGPRFLKVSKETGLGYGIIIVTSVFFLGSVFFFFVEHGVNPHVQTFEDSLWYMITTMTTTGYGDIVPVTGVGRIIGTITMLTGVGFASYATASIASLIFQKLKEEREEDAEKLRKLSENFHSERKADDEEIKGLLNEILHKMDENDKKE